MRKPTRSQSGMTIIELLVVISIIAILIAMLTPALTRARENGKIAHCQNNLKQLGTALMMYTDDNDEYFPLVTGWDTNLLPYVTDSIEVFLCNSDTYRETGATGNPRTYSANGDPSASGQDYPFGTASQPSLRTSDIDYHNEELILLAERPEVGGARGYIGTTDGLALQETPGTLHKTGTPDEGCNYLFDSLSVRYHKPAEVDPSSGTLITNGWRFAIRIP